MRLSSCELSDILTFMSQPLSKGDLLTCNRMQHQHLHLCCSTANRHMAPLVPRSTMTGLSRDMIRTSQKDLLGWAYCAWVVHKLLVGLHNLTSHW